MNALAGPGNPTSGLGVVAKEFSKRYAKETRASLQR